jgi:type IV secretory pathway VirD2 relaxase
MNSDGHSISLKVPKHAPLRNLEVKTCQKAMRLVMRVMQATSKSIRRAKAAQARSILPKQIQRAAVRVTYIGPKSAGLWKAHGSYLQRQSATGKEQAGFNAADNGVNLPKTLDEWQRADDPRMFKIILSPEFGEGIEMERYTRSVMSKIESDVGAPLEWVAVAHYNTDHAHVHVALRSVTKDNRELQFPKEYIRQSIRAHAQIAATDQIGHRSQRDIEQAREREVTQPRFTSLDRAIERLKPAGLTADSFEVAFNPRATKALRVDKRAEVVAITARLRNLEKMGLATALNPTRWAVNADFAAVLKTIQATGDRQRTFARQMALASDMNLPVIAEDWRQLQYLQGRILGHGEDESKGKHFMLIEGTDGKIHYLTHRRETEQLRASRELQVNEFVTIAKNGGPIEVRQFGDAEQLLQSRSFLFSQPLPEPSEYPRPGWLGRFDRAVLLNGLSQDTTHDQPIRKGDAIPIERQSKMPEPRGAEATVTGKQPDPADLDQAAAIGRSVFKGREFRISNAREESQRYRCHVVGATPNYIVTSDGQNLILHSKDKFDRLPGIGRFLDIQYTATHEKPLVVSQAARKPRKDLEL